VDSKVPRPSCSRLPPSEIDQAAATQAYYYLLIIWLSLKGVELIFPERLLYNPAQIAYKQNKAGFVRTAQSAPSGRLWRAVFGDPSATGFLPKKQTIRSIQLLRCRIRSVGKKPDSEPRGA
jgi:hypothetical protein